MSNFTPLVTKKFEFEGDVVTVKFARLKRKHMLRMLPLLNKLNEAMEGPGGEGEDAPMTDEQMQIMQTMLEELGDKAGDYIRTLEGLTDAAGTPITVEQLTEDSYFMSLFADLLTAMVDASIGPSGKA